VISGIVVALPEELTTLTSKKLAKGCVEKLDDKTLVIYSGAGADNARTASELLVAQGVSCLISWGCAAALDASFRPGYLVLTDSCIAADNTLINLSNNDWLSHTKTCLAKNLTMQTYSGKLAESKSIVASSHDKSQIAKATGAIALDMESAAIAKAAQAHNLPFLAIRAIADPFSMDLPQAISHALNEQGDVVLGKLLRYLVMHPTELPNLIRLGLHFYAAKNTLKRVAKELAAITGFNSPNPATP
jgi:adenosylhomocysteine nucleosidase